MNNEIISWGTNKNPNGTFTGVVYTFKSLKERDPETGNYATKNKIIWSREFKTRATAAYHCKKGVKEQKKLRK